MNEGMNIHTAKCLRVTSWQFLNFPVAYADMRCMTKFVKQIRWLRTFIMV